MIPPGRHAIYIYINTTFSCHPSNSAHVNALPSAFPDILEEFPPHSDPEVLIISASLPYSMVCVKIMLSGQTSNLEFGWIRSLSIIHHPTCTTNAFLQHVAGYLLEVLVQPGICARSPTKHKPARSGQIQMASTKDKSAQFADDVCKRGSAQVLFEAGVRGTRLECIIISTEGFWPRVRPIPFLGPVFLPLFW
jgi:hypothetical protein